MAGIFKNSSITASLAVGSFHNSEYARDGQAAINTG
jgi:hypothetical protein